jgi:hypothetical protein
MKAQSEMEKLFIRDSFVQDPWKATSICLIRIAAAGLKEGQLTSPVGQLGINPLHDPLREDHGIRNDRGQGRTASCSPIDRASERLGWQRRLGAHACGPRPCKDSLAFSPFICFNIRPFLMVFIFRF